MAGFAAMADPLFAGSDRYMGMSSEQWPTYEDGYEFTNPHEAMQDTRLMMSNTASHGLSSMQRFFGGYDESPFTASPFHSSLRKLEIGGGLRPHVPDNFPRGGSPADTASSTNSYWTPNHSEYAADRFGKHSVSSQTSYSPSMMSCDGYDASPIHQAHFLHGGGCVSLNNIQQYDPDQTNDDIGVCATADHSSVQPPYEHMYDYNVKSEYHDSHQECEDLDDKPSITDHEDSEHADADHDEDGSDTDYKPARRASGTAKRPRRRSSQSSNGSIRGNKRGPRGRKDSLTGATTGRIEKSGSKHDKSAGNRHFPCPLAGYGCTSSFTSKNEWKRHVSTQHIKLIYWRCDLCPPGSDPRQPAFNDFNRKDLFTQHLRRMHANIDMNGRPNGEQVPKKGACLTNAIPDDVVAAHQKRCCREIRQLPPHSKCLFCPRTFSGKDSWVERMDHIGSHLEKDRKSNGSMADHTTWQDDVALEAWLLDEGLVVRNEKGRWALGDGVPLRAKQGTH